MWSNCTSECRKTAGIVVLIVGIVYLLADYGVITFTLPSWWTTVFLFIGLHKVGHSMKPGACGVPKSKKK